MILRKIRIIALCVAVALLLSGCGSLLTALTDMYWGGNVVKFADMEYSRPDLQELETALQKSCDMAVNGENVQQVVDSIYEFYDVYDRFYTSYSLAQIHYYCDTTDIYWEEEYNYCLENGNAGDAALEQLYYALAASPYRQELEAEAYFGAGFFDAYEGESVWDDTYLSLLEQESQLLNRYYEITEEAAQTEYYSEEFFVQYGSQLAELFVELVALRQQIADYAGYDSYVQYAYDLQHYRDYSPEQVQTYLQTVADTMADLYCRVNQSDIWEQTYEICSETQMYRHVKTAAENMGGYTKDAFSLLERGQLYDIAFRENKLYSSFELYLLRYYEPFIFVCPTMSQDDKLTFAHEFGHFANDYVCGGSLAGTDVAEVHSQALEYLSLLYGEGTKSLETYKLADSLCIFVEQSAYALFEQQVYDLKGDALTAENVQALYADICTEFGFDSVDWDSRGYVCIEHFFTSPLYIVSYVVSNDVAFQIYQMEKETVGTGLAVYNRCLESQDSYLLQFTETYGLESPFADGRLETVRDTLQQGLSNYL